jgi:hypothetical protein
MSVKKVKVSREKRFEKGMGCSFAGAAWRKIRPGAGPDIKSGLMSLRLTFDSGRSRMIK